MTTLGTRISVHFIYPAFHNAPVSLSFDDQFAYRPSGSTAAAIITILHKVTHLLTNPYVVVIALDFSKAFDTVRHATLLNKFAQLDIPDCVYNWLVDFFTDHTHKTKYDNQMSSLKFISASIIQGSGVGPTSYVVNASDLQAVTEGNELCKYADDTYLIIPAVNVDSRSLEIANIKKWAEANNLQLNLKKSEEIIFVDKRRKTVFSVPDEIPMIKRVQSIKILGVTLTNGLSVSQHIQKSLQHLLKSYMHCEFYALMACASKHCNPFSDPVIAKLMYASSAWWGFASVSDGQKIEAFIRRSTRAGFCSELSFDNLCNLADDQLFHKILKDTTHVLHHLLPPVTSHGYSLRLRKHNRQLPEHTTRLINCNFIIRMLYCDSY